MARRLWRGFCFIGVLAGLALGAGFLMFAWTLESRETMPLHHADGLVALTGGSDRIVDAVSLLARGDADRLLISGVNPNTSLPEIARVAPEARPFVDCCIELGYAAENTVGNAIETSQWVRAHNVRSLIVVTSNYHMPRALVEIGHAAPDVELLPFPVVTERARADGWWADGQRVRVMLFEYLKYVATLARLHVPVGRLTPTPAEPA